MGITERKEKEKLIRRNDIIDAAERIIAVKGYQLATMDDIAAESEFSKRTVYIYFNSKEQLYFEIMVRGYKILSRMIEESLRERSEADQLTRIKQIGIALFRFKEDYPDYFKAIMSYENGEKDFINGVTDASREECYRLGEEIFGYLTKEIADGIACGVIRRELDITNTAILLWSFVLGLFNTLTKKNNYLKNYHHREQKEMLFMGLDFLMESIRSTAE